MDATLRPITAALAELRDRELRGLIAAANRVPQVAPGFVAWIEHATDWEIHQRRGRDFYLQSPGAAIDPSEGAASVAAAMILRQRFEREAPDVAALFDAIVGALGWSGSRN
jgi:hypothetical protein